MKPLLVRVCVVFPDIFWNVSVTSRLTLFLLFLPSVFSCDNVLFWPTYTFLFSSDVLVCWLLSDRSWGWSLVSFVLVFLPSTPPPLPWLLYLFKRHAKLRLWKFLHPVIIINPMLIAITTLLLLWLLSEIVAFWIWNPSARLSTQALFVHKWTA